MNQSLSRINTNIELDNIEKIKAPKRRKGTPKVINIIAYPIGGLIFIARDSNSTHKVQREIVANKNPAIFPNIFKKISLM